MIEQKGKEANDNYYQIVLKLLRSWREHHYLDIVWHKKPDISPYMLRSFSSPKSR